jgi:hypothetical protein
MKEKAHKEESMEVNKEGHEEVVPRDTRQGGSGSGMYPR